MAKISRISSIADIEILKEDLASARSTYCTFLRGHGREYKLLPTIGRNGESAEKIKQIEESVLQMFKFEISERELEKFLIPIANTTSAVNQDWLKLFQLQHLGLPTRLIDWTISPEVACAFATDPKDWDYDGELWVFLCRYDWLYSFDNLKDYWNIPIAEIEKHYVINHPFFMENKTIELPAEYRRMKQFGRFSIQSYKDCITPMENQDLFTEYLIKISIKAEDKQALQRELVEQNANYNINNLLVPLPEKIKNVVDLIKMKLKE